jgi:DNA-binding transcriptional LysR family regulator
MAAQQNAIAAGSGIGLLPFFSAKKDARLVPLLLDKVRVTRDLYITVHEDLEYMGRVKALTRFLSALFASESAYLNEFE